jgi:ABC-type polysaccharide/polyol phosphate transport system ATPase subunit
LRTGFERKGTTRPLGLAPDVAIRLDDVSVKYRLPKERIPSIKEYTIRRLTRRLYYESLLALNGVSLEIKRGEVFGLVGPNGAGKSTLLKLVARVLKPTSGRVIACGRVAPLLELGAGFDMELTGRENVYLNAAILGLSRQEVHARFERIVEFAGLRDFIDAPLRTYSSGMVTRLGFAVATDVDPDILIVDETLAVGDAEFQHKSAERIAKFRDAGVTILVASHEMSAVAAMCTRAAWLAKGQLCAVGPAAHVIEQYLGRAPHGAAEL